MREKGMLVGNVHYRPADSSLVSFWKMQRSVLPDQLVTLARCLREAPPIADREISPTALNQARMFQFPGSICDRWPLDAQHFGEQILRDRQCVIIAAVTHHQQPTRQPFLEAVCAIACSRQHDLLGKGLDVSIHESAEAWHQPRGPRERGVRHLYRAPRN